MRFLKNLTALFLTPEDRILQDMRYLCHKANTGICLKGKCPYFMARNPFRTRACMPQERFESCPLLDFNEAVLRRKHEEFKGRYPLPKGVDVNEC